MVGQVVPLPLAIWLAPIFIFVLGVGLAWRDGLVNLLKVSIFPNQLAIFAFILLFAFFINRGLALFDDFAMLPTASLIATGDIPPHFPLNPKVGLEYHYFGLMFSAQMMRVANLLVWNAVDLMRALYFALAVMLASLWARRLTYSLTAGFLTGLMVALGSGTRWLLLLLPTNLLDRISPSIHMLGTGIASGETLSAALISNWGVEGGGPLPIPFAFTNGVYLPGVFGMLGSNSLAPIILTCLLLLTCTRWRGWRGGLITAAILACLSLIRETTVLFWLASWSAMTGIWMVRNHSLRLPVSLRKWWIVLLTGSLVGLFQGGVLTNVLYRLLFATEQASQQTIVFSFSPIPSLVSGHLGVLALN